MGFYHKTTTIFLEEERFKKRFDKYLSRHDEANDKDDYQITRYYTNGFQDESGSGDRCEAYNVQKIFELKLGEIVTCEVGI